MHSITTCGWWLRSRQHRWRTNPLSEQIVRLGCATQVSVENGPSPFIYCPAPSPVSCPSLRLASDTKGPRKAARSQALQFSVSEWTVDTPSQQGVPVTLLLRRSLCRGTGPHREVSAEGASAPPGHVLGAYLKGAHRQRELWFPSADRGFGRCPSFGKVTSNSDIVSLFPRRECSTRPFFSSAGGAGTSRCFEHPPGRLRLHLV